MRFMDNSDQFLGCCLSLLPLLNSQFACLPPHFASMVTNDVNMWLDTLHISQFPMVANIPKYGMLTRMCLASLLYHRQWIFQKFMVNHVVHCCCIVFCDDDVMRRCNKNPEFVVVLYPWNDASGVPLYVAMLSELTLL